DDLHGGDGVDWLYGGDGADSLAGDGSDDNLHGDAGADRLSGDDGNDTLNGDDGKDMLAGGAGDDSLAGGEGDDNLRGDAGDDAVQGGVGADLVVGGAGSDTLDGNDGNDTIWGDRAGGDAAAAHLAADDGAIQPVAAVPGASVDFLNGGTGDDVLHVGAGDYANGGDGADQFALHDIAQGDPVAQIMDFNRHEDSLVLIYDPSHHADPQITVSSEAGSPHATVMLDGVPVAQVMGGAGLVAADVVLQAA
ncbi:MAG: calcium-binding protein, partial [Pseudorhodobacter sp.]|nr:calcium-binding protein [Pseudorhodobacter sp.]